MEALYETPRGFSDFNWLLKFNILNYVREVLNHKGVKVAKLGRGAKFTMALRSKHTEM